MSELERCHGGYPGGVHSYREAGGEVRCPICDGTGFKATKREFANRVNELELERDRLRASLAESRANCTEEEVRGNELQERLDDGFIPIAKAAAVCVDDPREESMAALERAVRELRAKGWL